MIANEIDVVPPSDSGRAKEVNSDPDAGMDKNLDAALGPAKFKENVDHSVKNGVVTLTGEVHSQTARAGKGSLPGCRTVSKS